VGPDGAIGERIRAAGVRTLVLNVRSPAAAIGAVFRAVRELRVWKADVLQGWMYHGNLAAWLFQKLGARRARLLWNIRCTVRQLEDFPAGTRRVIKLNARLSRSPDAVIFNSEAAVGQHRALGFRERSTVVLPNGFDLSRYVPDPASRNVQRTQLGIRPGELLIGLIARYHPMKDFPNFIEAIRVVLVARSDVRVLLAGPGVDSANRELGESLERAGIADRVILRGEIINMPATLAALDVFCLSSAWGEGFPNVVGEAMACGTPCVGTDVGDVRAIVGDTGYVVAPGDPRALGAALTSFLSLPPPRRTELGEAARTRVRQLYDISAILERYLQTYVRVVS
jgi:glycosyltransferase involved in cell wall biosynthesis